MANNYNHLLTREGRWVTISDDELYHWKYTKREKVNGKWVYTYPDETTNKKPSLLDSIKNLFGKKPSTKETVDSNKTKQVDVVDKGKSIVSNLFNKVVKTTTDAINKQIQKGLDTVNKTISKAAKDVADGVTDNKYVITRSNREEKIAEIKKTKEWQDIVKRQDPEYVKKDSQGNVQYLIDDYIVKKKHPELDLIDDIANGRKLSLNELNFETFAAAATDYVRSGAVVLGVASKALMTKFKFSQGAYDEDIERVVTKGSAYVDNALNTAKDATKYVNKDNLIKTAKSVVEKTDNEDLKRVVNSVDTIVKTVEGATDKIDKDQLNSALKNINEVSKTASNTAEAVQNVVNDVNSGEIYAKVLKAALQNISEEELRRILQSMK